MRPFLITLPFCIAFSLASHAQEEVQKMSREISGHQLQYLEQHPSGEKPAKGWPLLLFLHGSGERGTEIGKVKVHGPPKVRGQFAALQQCVIISPQCPRDSWWRVQALKTLIDEVIARREDIDRDRIYVTGLSMGGYGTWCLLSNYPETFAAAIPICGGGDPFRLRRNGEKRPKWLVNEFRPEGLAKAKNIPIWNFHGAKDNAVPQMESDRLVTLLKEAGSKSVTYTVYPDAGHVDAWKRAYGNEATWTWLFSQ